MKSYNFIDPGDAQASPVFAPGVAVWASMRAMMQLRDYQSALANDISALLSRSGSVVLQLPTGGGKTHIAATLAQDTRKRGKRVWFVCHRREIVQQTSRALDDYGVSHGVIAAGYERWPNWQVQVCSIGSLVRALKSLPPPDLIIWDECHHVAAPSWSSIKDRYPKARHLGLTATPERLDGVGLRSWFHEIICGPSTRDLIAAGHLSPYRMFAPTIPDLSGVKVRAGDYAKEQLGEAMSTAALVGDVVDHYQRLAPNARAIAFAASVRASMATVDRFNAAGIPARHVDGRTPTEVRDEAISALEAGEIRLLSNVEVFTEGFDLPAIDAVILLRPTKSLALYRQMIGRGLRTAEGKATTIILDHAALVHEHGLPDEEATWSLDGKGVVGSADGNEARLRLRRCPECSAVHPFAAQCSECGHEYTAKDRSIEEVFGHLHEVRRLEGHDTYNEFAKRIGATPSGVRQMCFRGMPRTAGHLIPVGEAVSWLRKRKTGSHVPPLFSEPGEYERAQDFAVRIGRTYAMVKKFKGRGLPVGPNGWVHVEQGLAWIATNGQTPEDIHAKRLAKANRPAKTKPTPLIGDTIKHFAERVGVTYSTVSTWKLRGLPCHHDGSIDHNAAVRWLHEYPQDTRGPKPPPGYESVKAFARRVGVSGTGGARGLLKRGLPVAPNQYVNIKAALAWVSEHGATAASARPRTKQNMPLCNSPGPF